MTWSRTRIGRNRDHVVGEVPFWEVRIICDSHEKGTCSVGTNVSNLERATIQGLESKLGMIRIDFNLICA
jgi:hypothetical protein